MVAEYELRILLFWYYSRWLGGWLGGWLFRSDNIANSAQLSWTGAWAELGNIDIKVIWNRFVWSRFIIEFFSSCPLLYYFMVVQERAKSQSKFFSYKTGPHQKICKKLGLFDQLGSNLIAETSWKPSLCFWLPHPASF